MKAEDEDSSRDPFVGLFLNNICLPERLSVHVKPSVMALHSQGAIKDGFCDGKFYVQRAGGQRDGNLQRYNVT